MRYIVLILLFWPVFSGPLKAQTIQDQRRIEEEKRDQLRPSESRLIERRELPVTGAETPQQAYFRNLLSQRTATLSDAYTVLLILMGKDARQNFEDQRDTLKNSQILPDALRESNDPQAPLRKGITAYMVCKLLDIRGGIWMRLFGVSQRYALRELVYEKIMPAGHVNEVVSGKELIFITTQAANYLADQQTRLQPDRFSTTSGAQP